VSPIPGQTGRLFLPADIIAGSKMSSDVVLALEVSTPIIKDYPAYKFKAEFRMQFIF
jgi:hypothetical protein